MSTKKEQVFLTGSTGYLGRSVVESLIRKNYRVTALCRSIPKNTKNLNYLEGQIENIGSFARELNESSVLIHLANISRYEDSEYKEMIELNIHGTKKLLEAIKIETSIKKIIYISSANVTGFRKEPSLDSKLINLDVKYIETKREAEKIIRKQCLKKNIDFIIIRPGTIYGKNSLEQGSKKFLKDLLSSNKSFWFVPPGGTSIINISTLSNFIVKLVEKKSFAHKEIVTIEHNLSYKKLFFHMAKLNKKSPRIITIPNIILSIIIKLKISFINIDMLKISTLFSFYDNHTFLNLIQKENVIPLEQTLLESLNYPGSNLQLPKND